MDLGDRMKSYENVFNISLPIRTPLIMRLDGRSFHRLTRYAEKPFDMKFIGSMQQTCRKLMREIQDAVLIYNQSDEISVLMNTYRSQVDGDAWFQNRVEKIISISSGIASVEFTKDYGKEGIFDSRIFSIPKEDVENYFIWRQEDWIRNSIGMLARSLYSQKELNNIGKSELLAKIQKKGKSWNDIADELKYGSIFTKNGKESYIFKENRNKIRELL